MKTKIAAILILIYEVFAAGFVGVGFSASTNQIGDYPILYDVTPALFISSFLLVIAACMLLTKVTKAAWWSCVSLAFINLGIMCSGIIYYLGLGTRCNGPYQITPNKDIADFTILVAVIIVLALLFLLSDIKRLNHITTTENLENKDASPWRALITSIVIYIIIILLIFSASSGGVYNSSGEQAYISVKSEIENAVAGYMQDSNHSSQLPIISDNATFTLTNPNGSYYIINMSALLIRNGGLMKTIPTGIIQLPGPNNDNCDGGTTGCHDTNHYIWGVDSLGNIASKFVNSSEINICQCNTCDGYQGVWP